MIDVQTDGWHVTSNEYPAWGSRVAQYATFSLDERFDFKLAASMEKQRT